MRFAIFSLLIAQTLLASCAFDDFGGDLEEVTSFVSKVDPKNDSGWPCHCYNSTESFSQTVVECRCYGKEFKEVPIDLHENLHKITITHSEMKVIECDSFQPYRYTLHDVILENMPSLRVIEAGTFRDMPNLRTIYISHSPQIKFLHGLFDGVTAKKFLSLRIVRTSLIEIPDLSNIHSDNIMHMVDLDGNKIERIRRNAIKIKAGQVTLNYNQINFVEDLAFNGSQIGKLSLRGNRELTELDKNAFKGLNDINELDLSETSIKELPLVGLTKIEVLKIDNTPSMKVIPSVYDFSYLKEAHLTHPFHCCAFKYPEQHDPKRHAEYEEILRRNCQKLMLNNGTNQGISVRKRRSNSYEDYDDEESWGAYNNMAYESSPSAPSHWDQLDMNGSNLPALRGQTIEWHDAKPIQQQAVLGTFHDSSAELTQIMAFCGNLTIKTLNVICYPEPNALNPCEDIMGSYYLRISVWFVVVLSVLGNLAVIIVVLFSGAEVTVPRFLMCNLAFADLCMGLYLLLIASMDLHSVGTYFNFAFDWQYGFGCQVAGFLTVFASQLSIFTLTIVTVERWFAIAYAIYLTRRIRLGLAAKVMIGGWIYSFLMASLPLFGVSNYSSTSICLPMEVKAIGDKAYLISMIAVNGLAFVLIVFCYAQIYFSLAYETRHTVTLGEMTIAKKMALLVFTDFVCWAPIAFFALTALAGYPLIGVTRSKILLVFFYPLNSCANPYLYAITTAQYRKDFFVLLSRLGLCSKKTKKYGLTTTLQTNTHPVPLITRSNGRKTSTVLPTSGLEDAFV